ncbi:MAG: response regulator [Candidatus Micrarchaeia archaeon]
MAKATHSRLHITERTEGKKMRGILPPEKAEKKKVLIVDDEYLNRTAISRLLKSRGMQVHTAETAQKALELLGKYKFDVIVLDFDMPDMNGLELFREMEEPQRKNTVFYTSNENDLREIEKTGRPRVGKEPELLVLEIEKVGKKS